MAVRPLRVTLGEMATRALQPLRVGGRVISEEVTVRGLLRAMGNQIRLFKGKIDQGVINEIAASRQLRLKRMVYWARAVDLFLKEFISFLPLEGNTLVRLLEIGEMASSALPEQQDRIIKEQIQGLVEAGRKLEEKKLKSRRVYPLILQVKINPEEVAKEATGVFQAQLKEKPDSNLGLATGSTQLGLYSLLAAMQRAGQIDFSKVPFFFNLDEYIGIPGRFYDQTYEYYMGRNFFDPLGLRIRTGKKKIPAWYTDQPARACELYEQAIIEAGGIDLQLMGLGPDTAHFAFCESGTPINLPTHVVSLGLRTRIANSRNFMTAEDLRILGLKKGEDPFPHVDEWDRAPGTYHEEIARFWNVLMPRVPTHAMTMGPKTILEQVRQILMLATGEGKAEAVFKTVMRDPTIMVPASLLKFHPYFRLIVDQAAASKLPEPYNRAGVYEVK